MKKLISLFALLCCVIIAIQAQTNTRVLGSTADDEFKSIIQAANGDWILGGTRTVGADRQYVLTRTNAAGTTVLWTHTYGNVNQAEVLTAVQKADLAFRMMLQVRNKLIEAYHELQQIQI